MKSAANWPGGLAGSCQVSQPLPVLTPAERYWNRYFQGTPLEVIQVASRLLSPNWRRSLGRGAGAACTTLGAAARATWAPPPVASTAANASATARFKAVGRTAAEVPACVTRPP